MINELIIRYLETTGRCNYNCPICIDRTRNFYMSDNDFYSIVNKNREILFGQRLWVDFCGEPLMDSHIFERIRFLTSIGSIVQLSTNGSLLNDENIIKLINSGVDYVVVSIPSLYADVYKTLRGIDNLETVLNNLFKLKCYINESATTVQLQAVAIDIGKDFNRDEYIQFFHEKGIHTAIHQFTNRTHNSRINISIKHKLPKRAECIGLKHNIAILSDCEVVTCCCDLSGKNSLGNLRNFDYSVKELIKASRIDDIINKQKQHIYENVCNNCDDWIYYQKESTEEYVQVYSYDSCSQKI